MVETYPQALVVRTSAFFGPWDRNNFVTRALTHLGRGRSFAAADDVWVSPTYVPDLVETSRDPLIDGERGIWHIANSGATTWYDLALKAAELAGVDPSALEARRAVDLGRVARRPVYSVLGSERGWMVPDLDDALIRFVRDRACFGSNSGPPAMGNP